MSNVPKLPDVSHEFGTDTSARGFVTQAALQSEFSRDVAKINAIIDALDLITRSDGQLLDQSVRNSALHPEVLNILASGEGWKPKADVHVASVGNINLAAPGATIDTRAMASGERMLLKNQTVPAQNGIYIWNGAASAATRSTDAATAEQLGYAFVSVLAGSLSTQAGTAWVCSQSEAEIVSLGTTPITFGQTGGQLPSAAMQPVIRALTLALAQAALFAGSPILSFITAVSLTAARAALGPYSDALFTPTGGVSKTLADFGAETVARTLVTLRTPAYDPPLSRIGGTKSAGHTGQEFVSNADMLVGTIRNVLVNTEDLSVYAATSATKDGATTMDWRGIVMSKVSGSNYYGAISFNIGGLSMSLQVGKKYLLSYFIKSMAKNPLFISGRGVANTTDYGHGAHLVLPTVRRVRKLFYATTSTQLSQVSNPSVLPSLETGQTAPKIFQYSNLSGTFDLRIGGMQLELVPDAANMGIALIGDSTVAGAAGKKDVAASQEWSRWLEGFLCCECYNRGVGGETTTDMLARFDTDITPIIGGGPTAAAAKYCIIQGGINDIIASAALATIQSNILAMAASAVTSGAIPVLCTITPFLAADSDPVKEAVRVAFNDWVWTAGYHVLDLATVVADPYRPSSLRRDSSGWYGDGTHFGAPAKQAIGAYAAEQEWWDFPLPGPYQKRAGNINSAHDRQGRLRFEDGGLGVFDAAGTGNLSLKADDRLTNDHIRFTGILTGNRTFFIQSTKPRVWIIENATTGAFTLSVQGLQADLTTAQGAVVAIAQGERLTIIADGTGLLSQAAIVFVGSATYDPASLADGVGVTTTVSVPGAVIGDYVSASFSNDLQGITFTGWISAPNVASVRFQNETTAAVDLASGTIRVRVTKA